MSKKYTPRQFAKALEDVAYKVRGDTLAKIALAGGYVIEGHAKINVATTFKNTTGNLANGIQTNVVSSTPNRAVVEVGPTAIYGRIQEKGGTIRPLTAKQLHWVDENGKHHVALKVTLPARPYLAPAVDNHVNEIVSAIAENARIEIEGAI